MLKITYWELKDLEFGVKGSLCGPDVEGVRYRVANIRGKEITVKRLSDGVEIPMDSDRLLNLLNA